MKSQITMDPYETGYETFRDHNSGIYAYEDADGWDRIKILGEYESFEEAEKNHPNKNIMKV